MVGGLGGDIEGEDEEEEEEVEAVSTAGSAAEALLLRKDDKRLISANGLRLLLGVLTGVTVASEEEEARRNLWPLVEVVEGDGAGPPPSLLAFLPRVSTWSENCRFVSPVCAWLPACVSTITT
jgi:hypothetical protein